MDDKELQIYQLLYQAYADEIKNLWQRSIFLATFMVLVWTGYGALQLKALDKDFSVSAGYCLVSFGLCGVIIILSLLWIAMAKGSKFVQEAHEEHIKKYVKLYHYNIYCNLGKYQKKIQNQSSYDLFLNETLKAYRYSPSKINIALGWVSLLASFILSNLHIFLGLEPIKNELPRLLSIIQSKENVYVCIFSFILILIGLINIIIFHTLKGTNKKYKSQNQGAKMTFCPFKKYGETILYENNSFIVVSGYDERNKHNHNGANFLSIGLSTNSPTQWFCIGNDLAIGFLRSLVGKIGAKDKAISKAIQKLRQQNLQEKDTKC